MLQQVEHDKKKNNNYIFDFNAFNFFEFKY